MHLWLPEASEYIKMQAKEGHGDKYMTGRACDIGWSFVGNWEDKDATWDRVGDFSGAEEFYRKYAVDPQYGCFGCPVQHFHIFDIPGRCKGTMKCVQTFAFAGTVWVNDRRVMVQANTLCQNYGLDSTGAGNAVSFLMELYHRGIISERDTDGIAMRRGDAHAILAAIEKIGKQEGFGTLFREGVLGAAKRIGKEAEECAVVVHGQEVEPYDVRAFKSNALAVAVKDGTAAHALPNIDTKWSAAKEKMEKLAEALYGSKEAAIPTSYEKKALLIWDIENRMTSVDLTGTCHFLVPLAVTTKLDIPAKLLSLATGRDTSEQDLLRAAQRILTLERAFRALRGLRRDTLPEKLFKTVVPDGVYKGERLHKKKFEEMLDEYYSLRGWDREGIPKEETFKKFDLSSEWKIFDRAFKKGL
jgi:aldehyde:ferredoxin oxidoreductase